MLKVGERYTRNEIADVIGLPSEKRKGDWLTGYSKHLGNFYVFVNIGNAARTGHDYPNAWDGNDLIWSAKNGSKIDHPQIQQLINGDVSINIFWRETDRASWIFAGTAQPSQIDVESSPVRVRWTFSRHDDSFKLPIDETSNQTIVRRGPPPSTGQITYESSDKPTDLYLLQLRGKLQSTVTEAIDGKSLFKVGISSDIRKRICQLNSGFPIELGLAWQLVSRIPFSNGRNAYDRESEVLALLADSGFLKRGEFAALSAKELEVLERYFGPLG